MPDRGLTHLDPLGRARMVDVTPKDPTHRRAVARGRVYMHPETTSLVARGGVGKGDVLAVARVAGIQAAKRASDLCSCPISTMASPASAMPEVVVRVSRSPRASPTTTGSAAANTAVSGATTLMGPMARA